jgi:hypothetical protein
MMMSYQYNVLLNNILRYEQPTYLGDGELTPSYISAYMDGWVVNQITCLAAFPPSPAIFGLR